MDIDITAARVVHAVFGAAWTGSTLAVALFVVPAARRGVLDAEPVAWIADRFAKLSVASVVVMLLSGGHLAGTLYTFELLADSYRGHLVLGMTTLWLVLAGLSHVATSRLTAGSDVRAAADDATPWFGAASAVSVALLVLAGML
ncbi:CopD family protein [Halobacterium litoreum]|uniref:CopD family protein n=1 Tax=Halobacterium litoreum TaxID=2039234 RepID=A0ABD5NGV8_9EURY|nr:CopD family protein [Halobacterium litoreum]UHH12864.1 CopD family protein [Halobacterium litoreum]